MNSNSLDFKRSDEASLGLIAELLENIPPSEIKSTLPLSNKTISPIKSTLPLSNKAKCPINSTVTIESVQDDDPWMHIDFASVDEVILKAQVSFIVQVDYLINLFEAKRKYSWNAS